MMTTPVAVVAVVAAVAATIHLVLHLHAVETTATATPPPLLFAAAMPSPPPHSPHTLPPRSTPHTHPRPRLLLTPPATIAMDPRQHQRLQRTREAQALRMAALITTQPLLQHIQATIGYGAMW